VKKSVFVLGVDGGGSKTEVVLAELTSRNLSSSPPNIIGRGLSGPSNIRSTGKSRALAHLGEAVDESLVTAGLQFADLDSVVLALAGSSYSDVQDHVANWCQSKSLESVYQLISDVVPVLYAGTPQGCGIALVAGTGSVCIGKNTRGNEASSGGWGHWFGDKGSGFDIGCRGMAAVAEAVDKIGPDTQLTPLIQKALQVDSPREILTRLSAVDANGITDEKYQIAQLAPIVIAAAESGDSVALGSIQKAAAELVRLVISIATSLYPNGQYPLALAGGTLCGSTYYRKLVLELLGKQQSFFGETKIVPNPVLGCLNISHERLFGGGA